jgi:hypothetical protein
MIFLMLFVQLLIILIATKLAGEVSVKLGQPAEVVPHKKWPGKVCPYQLLPHWSEFINKIKGSTSSEFVDDMYDLSYLKDYKFVGLRSIKQPGEIHAKITWAMEGNANCVLLTKRGFDLRQLQKALNKDVLG